MKYYARTSQMITNAYRNSDEVISFPSYSDRDIFCALSNGYYVPVNELNPDLIAEIGDYTTSDDPYVLAAFHSTEPDVDTFKTFGDLAYAAGLQHLCNSEPTSLL